MKIIKLQTFLILFYSISNVFGFGSVKQLVSDFTLDLVKSKHSVLFGCSDEDLIYTTRLFVSTNQAVSTINLDKSKYCLTNILSYRLYALTSVAVDCSCKNSKKLLQAASDFKYFNKTYQWLLIDNENYGLLNIFENIENVALNSQITYVNRSIDNNFYLYDIYSKGLHLKSPLEITLLGKWSLNTKFTIVRNIIEVQGIGNRKKFNGLKLRGVAVIDRENITSKAQMHELLTSPHIIDGVVQLSKYHYALIGILQQYLNFSVDYRITRGWAERLPNSSYRLGLLGVVQRNEADVAASPSLGRLNRFAEFDNIHQGWLFDNSFIFVYTSKLSSGSGTGGNFLKPFEFPVWIISAIFLILIALIWKAFEFFAKQFNIDDDKQDTFGNVSLQSIGAMCQQGLDPAPKMTTARVIVLTLIVFSFLLYNYYTSSVVGGLLSSDNPGPKNLDELVDSSLELSFQDTPYNRVIFKEPNLREIVKKIYKKHIHPTRKPGDLMPFAPLRMALKFIKQGTHGFHCELVAAYDEIAKEFDANEICNLRFVGGLFPFDVIQMIVTKRSQYTEIFRTIFHKARELGIIKRELRKFRPERPICQGRFKVEPVAIETILNSLYVLAGGILISGLILILEKTIYKYKIY